MKWTNVGEMPCSIARTASVIGDSWTMLILRNAFMRIRRFEDFQANLGLTRHLLASRLKRLVSVGILSREPYQQRPVRYEYRLTEKGRALYPIIMALTAWGDTWMDEGQGAPLNLQHKNCGKLMHPVTVCSECREPLNAGEVTAIPGPGLSVAMAKKALKATA